MHKQQDVIVVGAGIFGLSCAWACLRAGLGVLVLDRVGVGAGASGAVVGALSPYLPERWDAKKQFQFEALLDAEAHWQLVSATGGIASTYRRIGRIQPVADEKALAFARLRAEDARTLWQGRATWNVLPAGEMSHLLRPGTARFGVIHDSLSARIDPGEACIALAAAVRASGGEIETDWLVEQVSDGAVQGPRGQMKARTIIVAAGTGGFGLLSAQLPVSGEGVKGQAARLAADLGADAPGIFADGLYVVPHDDGSVAVGSTSERTWKDDSATDAQLEALIARAQSLCPALAGARVIRRWAGVRPRARWPDPMLGPVPGMGRVFVANGAFKIGFGIAHKVGEALAEMVAGKPVDLPDRFTVAHHLLP